MSVKRKFPIGEVAIRKSGKLLCLKIQDYDGDYDDARDFLYTLTDTDTQETIQEKLKGKCSSVQLEVLKDG